MTTPPLRVTSMVSMIGDHTEHMGFNPYRKFVARPADYVFIAVGMLIALGLVLWAFLG